MKTVLHDLDGAHAVLQLQGSLLSGTDAVLLAGAVSCRPGEAGCELGAGSGMASVLVALHRAPRRLYAVEIREELAALVRENAVRNGLEGLLLPVSGDLARARDLIPEKCDFVFSNPPYRRPVPGADPASLRDGALYELLCDLPGVCRAAAALLKGKGRFTLLWPASRMAEAFAALGRTDLEPKELLPVVPVRGRGATRLLITARKGARPGLSVRPAFVLKEADGSDSPEALRLYETGVLSEVTE